jgi:hypothetical protein
VPTLNGGCQHADTLWVICSRGQSIEPSVVRKGHIAQSHIEYVRCIVMVFPGHDQGQGLGGNMADWVGRLFRAI